MPPVAATRANTPRLLSCIVLAAAALRLLRLDWQPLWWDEGYSLYFATEPLTRMVGLTARDIHPPLYYALLHGWFALLADSGPVTARLFSVFCGIVAVPAVAWLARVLYPDRLQIAPIAALLLALSPMHLFYSQEVRMYAAVLPMTILASAAFYRLLTRAAAVRTARRTCWFYVAAATAALHTLYYAGLLLLSHQLWALWRARRSPRRLALPVAAGAAVLVAMLPWLFYALPKLIPYVADKVIADQDTPLPIWDYLWRHLVAFSAGHLPFPAWDLFRQSTPLILIGALIAGFTRPGGSSHTSHAPRLALASWIALPLLAGFLINLRLPFFPSGGERLLLTVLPYVYLLVADALIALGPRRGARVTALLGVLTPATLGLILFFTTPRHSDHDYRPIVRFITQHGRDQDSILALFPWQVGYWRAYTPRDAHGNRYAPQPPALEQEVLTWTPTMQAQIDAALQRGTLWFPAPLSFGSTLPADIEDYLSLAARPLENRWFSPATRVSAWVARQESPAPPTSILADYAGLLLRAIRIAPQNAIADNAPINIDLYWDDATPQPDLRATLRLIDPAGYVWAQRDFSPRATRTLTTDLGVLEQLALQVPVGLPPADYSLVLGVTDAAERTLLPTGASDPWTILGKIAVTLPEPPAPLVRLSPTRIRQMPVVDAWGRLLGTDALSAETALAGTDIALNLYWETDVSPSGLPRLHFVLVNARGAATHLPHSFPAAQPGEAAAWPPGTLLRLPVTVYLLPDLPAGDYSLALNGPQQTDKHTLGALQITRRATRFDPIAPGHPLPAPVQFGTHAQLIGFDWTRRNETLEVSLTWQVLQTLLPPHAVFVHAIDATGTRLAQTDASPITALGPAPTGSWLAGEWLTTLHTLPWSHDTPLPHALRIGLYNPANQVRLPAAIAGETVGDSADLILE